MQIKWHTCILFILIKNLIIEREKERNNLKENIRWKLGSFLCVPKCAPKWKTGTIAHFIEIHLIFHDAFKGIELCVCAVDSAWLC